MYCNIVFMIDIFVISKITQYRYYVIAITDVRSLGLSTKWRTLMIKKTMKVRENTFRKLEDPFENGAAKKYVFYVKVDDVAEGIPMATNPRDQKLTSGVATAIKESLLSNDGYFHLKNRGIVLSAESVHYNNKEKIATIIFSDELSHGNIDGGHTYKIVCEHKGENLEQYVQFEVMTGVEDIIENLAEARNTSVQVDAKSMAELAEKFDPIKEGLEGMPFFKRIAFKQNQISVDDETGKKNKMIDAREIVAIISMFNISLYDALHRLLHILPLCHDRCLRIRGQTAAAADKIFFSMIYHHKRRICPDAYFLKKPVINVQLFHVTAQILCQHTKYLISLSHISSSILFQYMYGTGRYSKMFAECLQNFDCKW